VAERLQRLVRALATPAFHGRGVARVDVIQTHISWVFLAGADVYKVKKPVRFSFLDFSLPERRRYFCEEEVRLNRRLAVDVYLGVLGLKSDGEGFAFCDEADPAAFEYAVHMRCLPHDRLLPQLLRSGEATTATIDTIVARLVAFHRDADAGPDVQAAGEPGRVKQEMRDDFAEMDRFRGVTIDAADDDRIRAFCLGGIDRRADLLRARCAAGRVRDGHGDLHAEHICLREPAEGGLAIFDCIEFNPAFRRRDVAGEIAFLAMDLEFRGRADLGRYLVETYASASGDADLSGLVPLFACHRAYIRGKVESLKSEEPEVGDAGRAAAATSARRYFELAVRYTWSETPVLVVVHGLSGSGKSTLARALATRTGFAHHGSDAIRKELAGLAPTSRVGEADERWLYSGEMSARTYAEMYARGERDLRAGRGAILDATFQRRIDRDKAWGIARRAGCDALFVECTAPEDEIVRRLRERAAANDDVSDATERVYRAQQAAAEAVADDEPGARMRIDTRGEIGAAVRRVEEVLDGCRGKGDPAAAAVDG
jgi:aminoglycoside phosphotransferase family enzyme/predicted kinase